MAITADRAESPLELDVTEADEAAGLREFTFWRKASLCLAPLVAVVLPCSPSGD